MKMRVLNMTSAITGGCVALFAATPALADDPRSDEPAVAERPAPTNGAQEYKDIIVTASRRTTTLQKTPLAVTKFDTEQLERSNIRDIADLQFFTPGLTYSRNGAAFTAIRGIGTNQPGSAVESGVATNVDGVYIGRASAVQPYYDLESVEVLRGPQGTLYGRNATGGVININSAAPQKEFGAGLAAIVGDFSRVRTEAYVTGPLSDGVAVRLSGLVDRRDSYLENIQPNGSKLREDRTLAVRGQIEGETGILNVRVVADYQTFNSAGQISQNFLGIVSPSAPPGTIFTTDPTKTAQRLDNDSRREAWGVSMTAELALGGGITLRSISGYRHNRVAANNNLSASSDTRSYIQSFERASQFTQELQLLSDETARFKWVVGAYYYRESVFGRYPLYTLIGEAIPIAPGLAAGPFFFQDDLTQDFVSRSIAGYGQATYAVTDSFRLTAGARYTHDRKKGTGGGSSLFIDQSGIFGPPAQVGGPASVNASWGSFTPKFGAELDLWPTTMVYASVTKGFKPGNSNLTVGSPEVRPETVWAYEGGLKTRLFDNRLRANLVGFYYDYTDLQVFGIIPGSGGGVVARFQNAAQARIKGFEAEIVAEPADGLTLNASYALLDARYGDYLTSDAFSYPQIIGGAPVINVKGNRLASSPHDTINLGAQYAANLGSMNVTPRVEYLYRSKVYFSQFQRDLTSQPGYSLLNARVSINAADDRWSVAGFVKNITNKHYFEFVGEAAGGNASAFYAAPRTIGVELKFKI